MEEKKEISITAKNDEIIIIDNFFNESFYGLVEKETYILINTNIRVKD